MQLAEPISMPPYDPLRQVDMFPRIAANADVNGINLAEMRIDDLREGIRRNQISFPSQVPTFPKHDRPDIHRKVVQLYFGMGWSGPKIGARYGMTRLRIQQILNAWKRRAVETGYVQTVPPAEVFTLPSEHPPIYARISPVHSALSMPIVQPPAPFASCSPQLTKKRVVNGTDPQSGYRPRMKLRISEIDEVLKHFQPGRTVAEMADESKFPAHTIRIWKKQREVRLLRREIAQLKQQLAKLGAVEKTLIVLITGSDIGSPRSFVPLS